MYLSDLEDIDIKVNRFFCKCMDPLHVLELTEDAENYGELEIHYHNSGKCGYSFWNRLKRAFNLLFMRDSGSWSEFILRDEDKQEFIEALRRTGV